MMMYDTVAQWSRFLGRALYFGVYRGAKGYGFPKPREQWNTEYQTGHWDYLSGGGERPVQMVVLGYAIHHHAAPSILDVGCGDGVLFDMLQRFPLAEYHGVDLSEEAIARVRRRALPQSGALEASRAVFTRADFENFAPSRRYDVIVFNNSLMYAEDPLWVLERFANFLAPGGIIVASLCYNPWQFPIWKRIRRRFSTLRSADVTNEGGLLWHVRVLERYTECLDSSASSEAGEVRANGAGPSLAALSALSPPARY